VTVPPAERTITGSFISEGERIFLGGIATMKFNERGTSFYLPKGNYKVHCLGWNLGPGLDPGEVSIEELMKFQHHALIFEGAPMPSLPPKVIDAIDSLRGRGRPNQSSEPTLASGTSPAGQEPRHP
jgi:hypothetical protein